MAIKSGRVARVIADTVVTFVTEILVLASFFLFYRLLLDGYGSEDVGVYALSRRIVAVLIPLVMLGLYEGMGRTIAMASLQGEKKLIILIGILSLFITLSLLALLLSLNAEAAAGYLFGSADYLNVVLPFVIFLLGLSVHTLAYAVLRGLLRMRLANALQILGLAIAPLLLVSLMRSDFDSLLSTMGVTHAVIAGIPLLWIALFGGGKIPWRKSGIIVRRLFSYSLPRVPNGVIMASLLAIGPYMATGRISMTEVGYLALAFSLLIGIGGFVSPLGQVLLPHLSEMVGRGEVHRIESRISVLTGAVIQFFIFICAQFYVFSGYLVTLWMGEGYMDAVPVITIVFMSVLFYGFFVAMRGVLDAVSTMPYNSINTIVTLMIFMLSIQMLPYMPASVGKSEAFAILFSASMVALGVLTHISLRRTLGLSTGEDLRHLVWGLLLSLAGAVLSAMVSSLVTDSLILFMMYQCILGILYLLLLWYLKFEWVHILLAHLVWKRQVQA